MATADASREMDALTIASMTTRDAVRASSRDSGDARARREVGRERGVGAFESFERFKRPREGNRTLDAG